MKQLLSIITLLLFLASVGTHFLARLMGLGIEFKGFGFVEGKVLSNPVEVAQIAHGLTMALVGSFLVILNSLGRIGFDTSVTQFVIEAHLELASGNIVVGQLFEIGYCFHMVDRIHIATCFIAIAHGIDSIERQGDNVVVDYHFVAVAPIGGAMVVTTKNYFALAVEMVYLSSQGN